MPSHPLQRGSSHSDLSGHPPTDEVGSMESAPSSKESTEAASLWWCERDGTGTGQEGEGAMREAAHRADPVISVDDLVLLHRIGEGGFSTTYLGAWTPREATELEEEPLSLAGGSTSPLSSGSASPVGVHSKGSTPLGKLPVMRRGPGSAGGKVRDRRFRRSGEGAEEGALKVAVKVASCQGESISQLQTELKAFAQLDHPNIVRFHGYVATPSLHCLVLEYCEGSDCYERLKGPTPAGFVLSVSTGVASALAYLHERRLMHRDVKSANVLLDKVGLRPKLTDFGVARALPDRTVSRHGKGARRERRELTPETGTYRWMAPEVIKHEPYSTSADVYSFAMVVYELTTHHIPFADRSSLKAAAAAALEDKRPTLPAGTPHALASLICRSWAIDRAERPPAALIEKTLRRLPSELTPAEIEWLDAPHGHPSIKRDTPADSKPDGPANKEIDADVPMEAVEADAPEPATPPARQAPARPKGAPSAAPHGSTCTVAAIRMMRALCEAVDAMVTQWAHADKDQLLPTSGSGTARASHNKGAGVALV